MDIATVLVTLDVFANLAVGDTLTWAGETLPTPNIQKYGPFQSTRRKYNGDNRNIMLQKVNDSITAALNLCDSSRESSRVRIHLLSAISGLKNLQKTYSTDVNVVSQLAVIVEEVCIKLAEQG